MQDLTFSQSSLPLSFQAEASHHHRSHLRQAPGRGSHLGAVRVPSQRRQQDVGHRREASDNRLQAALLDDPEMDSGWSSGRSTFGVLHRIRKQDSGALMTNEWGYDRCVKQNLPY